MKKAELKTDWISVKEKKPKVDDSKLYLTWPSGRNVPFVAKVEDDFGKLYWVDNYHMASCTIGDSDLYTPITIPKEYAKERS